MKNGAISLKNSFDVCLCESAIVKSGIKNGGGKNRRKNRPIGQKADGVEKLGKSHATFGKKFVTIKK